MTTSHRILEGMMRTRRNWISSWFAVLIALATHSAVAAVDQVISFPPGWTADPVVSPVAASNDRLAVALYNSDGSSESQVLILDGQEIRSSIVDGKVKTLEWTVNGDYLLAQHVSPEWPRGELHATLLALDGEVLWTKVGRRHYQFSSTGESLVAYQRFSGPGIGHEIEIFSLDGSSIRKASFTRGAAREPRDLTGVLALGDGTDVVVAEGRTVQRIRLEPFEHIWTVSLGESELPSYDLTLISEGQFVVRSPRGTFRVFNVDGELEYAHDPAALTGMFPTKPAQSLKSYSAFPGPEDWKLTLFNQSGDMLFVSAIDGSVVEGSDPTINPQPGYQLKKSLIDGKAVFVSSKQLRARPISHPEHD